jgi:ADP-ribose pyrophosphatase YjhB (NUDIX family)
VAPTDDKSAHEGRARRESEKPSLWRRGLRRAAKGLTLGVRGVVFDPQGRVLLVEHTYLSGWYFPGGGVERGESAARALERELIEEAGVQMLEPPELVSIHDNSKRFAGDQVLLYRVSAWRETPATSRGEIARLDFFDPGALPSGATAAVRRRLAELLTGDPPDPAW